MISRFLSFVRRSKWLTLVVVLQVLVLGLLANSLYQLRTGIERAYARGEVAREMLLAPYTLRQSSDYLTRFARHYVATGDPAYYDIFEQVLDIRRGEALRPKDYESAYWDLMEPYRSNAHPLLYPQSLENIFSRLPFTDEERELLEEAEQNSEELAEVEIEAFAAMKEGDQETAVQKLFSVDYLRGKHEIMKPIDELMASLRKRTEKTRNESQDDLQRQTQWVLGLAILFLAGNVLLYLRRSRPPTRTVERDSVKGVEDEA